MSADGFVHLRVHTAYSLSEGAILPKALAEHCAGNAIPAVAFTDTNNLFGALELSGLLAGAGVQPIVGMVLAVDFEDSGNHDQRRDQRGPGLANVVLLAQDATGYANLSALISDAFMASDTAGGVFRTMDQLADKSDGLILLTGGADGPLGQALQAGRADQGKARLQQLLKAFPDRTYMELQRHGLPAEAATEHVFLEWAYELDIPLVATNDVFFLGADMYEAQDALLCIADGKRIADDDRRQLTPEHRFKSAAEMREAFADLPEAVNNTLVIAQRCAFMVPSHDPILPKFETGGAGEADALKQMAEEGLQQRLQAHVVTSGMSDTEIEAAAKPYWDRLALELDVITGMDFPGYFLIVADFIQWAKDNGVPVGPGRGSGAGSVVAWALRITDLDPLRFGLLFERFLNPERVSMPDFDIDFCQEKRDRVIRYVQQKYGVDHVAGIITFGKLQARAALRDVGRVLGLPYGQVDRISKLVPFNPAKPLSLQQYIDGEPRLRAAIEEDDAVKQMTDIALKLEGLYRHASVHAAGIVIGDRPLPELVPLYRDPRTTMPVTQFSMKWAENAGLVKFDFLGLKTLSIIDRACVLLRAQGINVDIDHLPLDDAATYEMLSAGDSVGIFQLEGSGMRDALRRLRPDKFEDIIALVALYRPGPMENIPVYCKRKHGEEEIHYMHPLMKNVLEETYGVIIYQEQVMQAAQILAGYSLGEADLLRRAMGKKIASEMAAQRDRFEEGAVANGIKQGQARDIFDTIAKFADYGFNKSHAAAYALVAYQTAWLKAHHPVAFIAATMTFDQHNTDKLAVFRKELARLDIDLLPPDVNASQPDFSVEVTADGAEAVRYGLAAIKNVGGAAMASLVAEREENGPFRDLWDFARRLDHRVLNKRQLENLIRSGALDALSDNRATLLANVDVVLGYAANAAKERASNQENLFGGSAELAAPRLKPATAWMPLETLQHEYDALGFYLTAHPLDGYAQALRQQNVVPFAELEDRMRGGGAAFRLAGVIDRIQERKSQRGNPFAFVALSDSSGSYEITIFSDVLKASRDLLVANTSVVISVEARKEEEGAPPRLLAQSIRSLDTVVSQAGQGLRVSLGDEAELPRVQSILNDCKGGKGLVFFHIPREDRDIEIEIRDARFAITPAVKDAIGAIPGVIGVDVI